MRRWQRFPWQTVGHLLLTSWAVGIVTSLWVQAVSGRADWTFTFTTYMPWEPWLDGALLVLGIGYLGWRWLMLLRALWERWR